MYKNNNIFKITFTGMMLSLVILFQFLERYMPLVPGIFNINLSIFFILMTTFIVSYGYSLILLVLKWAISPALGSIGYSTIALYANTISFMAVFIFISLAYIAYRFKLFKTKRPVIVTLVTFSITTSLLMSMFNGLFLIDGWGKVIANNSPRDFITNIWGINSYWGAVFIVFMTGNMINLIIATTLFSVSYRPFKTYLAIK